MIDYNGSTKPMICPADELRELEKDASSEDTTPILAGDVELTDFVLAYIKNHFTYEEILQATSTTYFSNKGRPAIEAKDDDAAFSAFQDVCNRFILMKNTENDDKFEPWLRRVFGVDDIKPDQIRSEEEAMTVTSQFAPKEGRRYKVKWWSSYCSIQEYSEKDPNEALWGMTMFYEEINGWVFVNSRRRKDAMSKDFIDFTGIDEIGVKKANKAQIPWKCNFFPLHPQQCPARLFNLLPPRKDILDVYVPTLYICNLNMTRDGQKCRKHEKCGLHLKVDDYVWIDGSNCHLVANCIWYVGVKKMVGLRKGCKVGVIKVFWNQLEPLVNRLACVTRVDHNSFIGNNKDKKGSENIKEYCGTMASIEMLEYGYVQMRENLRGENMKVGQYLCARP